MCQRVPAATCSLPAVSPRTMSCAPCVQSCGSICGPRSIRQPSRERTWRHDNLGLHIDGRNVQVDVVVRPVLRTNDTARGFFLIVLEESEKPADDKAPPGDAISTSVSPVDPAHQLEDELVRLKAQLRDTIERHETQAEELKASNEELQAINEELRSSTEELETSKEELQSLNEELSTVNQELKIKIEEQVQANNDIQNLINSTGDRHDLSRSSLAHQAVYAADPRHLQPDSGRPRPPAVRHQQPPPAHGPAGGCRSGPRSSRTRRTRSADK